MSAAEFARFASRVAADGALTARLRPIGDRDALAAAAAAEGRARGFAFGPGDALAAMDENRAGWLMHPTPLLAFAGRPGDAADAAPPPCGGALMVDWCHLGAARFTAPFFFETVSLGIGHPFNAAFQQRRPAGELAALSPGLAPSGFVFHTARRGSTLVAQALASDPATS